METEEIENIARLLARVAVERPEALRALRELILAIVGPDGGSGRGVAGSAREDAAEAAPAGREQRAPAPIDAIDVHPAEAVLEQGAARTEPASAPETEPPRATDGRITPRACAEPEARTETPIGAEPTSMHAGAADASDARTLAPHAESRAPTEKDLASLRTLTGKFGSLQRGGGIAPPPERHDARTVELRPPFAADADKASDLSRFAAAQARQLRRLRACRARGVPFVPGERILVERCIDDWIANDAEARTPAVGAGGDRGRVGCTAGSSAHGTPALEADVIKVGERWYSLVARAFDVLAEWFLSVQEATLSTSQRTALRERLTAAALAQKGLYCWLSDQVTRDASAIGACGVQQAAFAAIRQWANLPGKGGFGVFIESGLQLSQRIRTEERRRIENDLDRLELEHAPECAPECDSDREPDPQRNLERDPKRAQPDAAPPRFDSVAEAFEAARNAFSGPLVFTERAEDSAERSPFVRPGEVFEVFEAMHAIALDLRAGALDGIPLEEAFEQRGHRKKPCSKGTMKRYRRFYHMAFGGHEIDLSQHVTLGSRSQNTCLSIHWWHDVEGRRFVIGHCGKHLPNTLS